MDLKNNKMFEDLREEALRVDHSPWCENTEVQQEVFASLNPVIAVNDTPYRYILFPQETKQETLERRRYERKEIVRKLKLTGHVATVYKVPKGIKI